MNQLALPADDQHSLYRDIRMSGNHLRVMVIPGTFLRPVTKELQDHALMDLEFYPAVQGDMGGDRHEDYQRYNNLRFHP